MPFGFQVQDFVLKDSFYLIKIIKIWSMSTFGQTASFFGSFHSRKLLTGGSLFSEISLFPLSTAPSAQILDDQYRRPNALFY